MDYVISQYFADIYKRPDYRRQQPSNVDFNVEESEEMKIDSSSSVSVSPFTIEEV